MNLDFGVLWIEDSYSPEEEESLKRRVREAGFVARIDNRPNGVGIEDLAREHKLFHLYDIVLLDYRLRDERGDELAPRIRDLFPSTTILFYSGSKDEQDLRELIAARRVEGVYCSARLRFIERAGSLIEQTARSLDRLSGMRGLAMRVVAECDEMMKHAVLTMSNRDPACNARIAELDADVLHFLDGLKERYQASISQDLDARLLTRAVDSAKLFFHFRRLTEQAANNPTAFDLDSERVDHLRDLRRQNARYDQDVLKKRNLLGHVIEVRTDSGWAIRGSEDIKSDDFPQIRRLFASHINAIRELTSLISTVADAPKDERPA